VNEPFAVTLRAVDGFGATLTGFTGTASLKGFAGGEITIGSMPADWDQPLNTFGMIRAPR